MKYNIGLVCMTNMLSDSAFKTMNQSSYERNIKSFGNEYTYNKLKEITIHNIKNSAIIMRHCNKLNLSRYRLTSKIVPQHNKWDWSYDKDIQEYFKGLKTLSEIYNIKLSFHIDHFCILASDNENVVINSIRELDYHAKMCNLMGAKEIVMHIGTTKNGKRESIIRLIRNFYKLDDKLKGLVCLENDDKPNMYNVEEILAICKFLKCKMILDIHHDKFNPSKKSVEYYKDEIMQTWNTEKPKLHLSSGLTRKHDDYIAVKDYQFVRKFFSEFDFMFECKAKDLAILQIIKNKGGSQ